MLMILCLSLAVVSCSAIDDENGLNFQRLNVRSVVLPDTLIQGHPYRFQVTYNRPTICHAFGGFDYRSNGNFRDIIVIGAVEEDRVGCDPQEGITGTADLNFVTERDDFYVFRFYQGDDEDGNPLFLTREIPVLQE